MTMNDKEKLNKEYGLIYKDSDSGKEGIATFLSGAILGYCELHTPAEVAELFDSTFRLLDYDKACSIAACISGKMLVICSEKEIEENV